ncbi:MAG: hypothetical protein EOO50_10110 [Flavobacterium sp.]|uniref:hypothetical protein n=1 Tax=Flavobacterium sp. TaxID=239 RepID=UPI0012151C64|nr:hypothetical protein [Flavobacterium sp.]RZJ66418.1 MAG: hypothetical protein EOO50_10110 [Flavobacterium sp.]
MNVSDFTYLLNHPETVNAKTTDELDKIVAEFPYFQSARALRLKGLYNEDSFRYNYALKVTAAFTADRSVLFDFITSDGFTSVDKGIYDKKREELHAITVSGIEHIEPIPAEEFVELPVVDTPTQEFLDDEPVDDFITGEDFVPIENTFEVETEPIVETEPTDETPKPDPATQSILDSIKEAEQFAKTITVEDAVEIKAPQKPVEIIPEPIAESEEVAETAKQNLEIGTPLDFSQNEKHSFQEWLQLSKIKPIDREEETRAAEVVQTAEDETGSSNDTNDGDDFEMDSERQKKNQLIDRFIETNPKIPQIKQDVKPQSFIFEPSQADNSYLMTETLARVYLEQKKFEKAIQAYE